MKLKQWLSEKLNPSQTWIAQSEPNSPSVERTLTYSYFYENLEIVNRSVNMIVDDASEINYTVAPFTDSASNGISPASIKPVVVGVRQKTLDSLLNAQPNPYQDIHSFRRNIFMDMMLDGNIFLYWDGRYLYQLPANKVVINSDPKTYIKNFVFNGQDTYSPDEIIHIKDNSATSLFRGVSRLKPALRTMRLMQNMRDFQDNFFNNGAVPGLVIRSPDVLSPRIKERLKDDWRQAYRPQTGGRNPLILDGGMTVDPLTNVSFKDLDFQSSISANEDIILKALGVPPILIDSGNNANIRPNHRIYYLETIIPIIKKFNSAVSSFFGFKVTENVAGIPALQPELRDEAQYYTTLVNGGIMDPNEARIGLNLAPKPGHDDLRVPQNIAGSATDPSQGGKPPQQDTNQ